MPNYDPEHLLFRLIVLRVVIWHLFVKIRAKVKHFLRLSQLTTIVKHIQKNARDLFDQKVAITENLFYFYFFIIYWGLP